VDVGLGVALGLTDGDGRVGSDGDGSGLVAGAAVVE
jgi:hypothetical protein